jgi:phosphoribosylformylglycinamidine (FGAM) synthase-like enzyme
MDVLFGKPPKMHRDTAHPPAPRWPALKTGGLDLQEAGLRVLRTRRWPRRTSWSPSVTAASAA